MAAVKGMVQVHGSTYRIVRLSPSTYEVIRVLDDTSVGTFRCATPLEIMATAVEPALLRQIARTAIQGAKTSWVGKLALPVRVGDDIRQDELRRAV
jgi:hypothetical protein